MWVCKMCSIVPTCCEILDNMTYDLLLMTLNDPEEFFQHVHTFQNYTTELIK